MLSFLAVSHEIQVPLAHPGETSIPSTGEATKEVQGGCGHVVGLDEAIGIRHTSLGRELWAVDDVTSVRRELNSILHLRVGRPTLAEVVHPLGSSRHVHALPDLPRLRKLASNSSQFHDRDTSSEGDNQGHLQQQPVEVPDVVRVELGESLSTIAPLLSIHPCFVIRMRANDDT